MASYATIFRTHVWDSGITQIAEQARSCCAAGEFIVAADETRNPLRIEGFTKLSHTEDFSTFGLPRRPTERMLWWNGDYVLYAARAAYPGQDYYVMLEFDVFLSCDIGRVIAQCAEGGIDLLVHDLRRVFADNSWYPT